MSEPFLDVVVVGVCEIKSQIMTTGRKILIGPVLT